MTKTALICLSLVVSTLLTRADNPVPGRVSIASPPYCSTISGATPIVIRAPGFTSATVKCWKQGGPFGADSVVGQIKLNEQGEGTVTFPADDYPHGPITVRITGSNLIASDNCYLQLYNKGGVSWNQGIPATPPPAARGMPLLFADRGLSGHCSR